MTLVGGVHDCYMVFMTFKLDWDDDRLESMLSSEGKN